MAREGREHRPIGWQDWDPCDHPPGARICGWCLPAEGPKQTATGNDDVSAGRQSEVELAREEFDLAWFWQEMTSSDLEGAYMSGDEERKRLLNHRLGVTSRIKARAWDRLEAARRAEAPSFEQLLADPSNQFDKKGVVAPSILAYQDAAPSTACGCRGEIHKGCAP